MIEGRGSIEPEISSQESCGDARRAFPDGRRGEHLAGVEGVGFEDGVEGDAGGADGENLVGFFGLVGFGGVAAGEPSHDAFSAAARVARPKVGVGGHEGAFGATGGVNADERGGARAPVSPRSGPFFNSAGVGPPPLFPRFYL